MPGSKVLKLTERELNGLLNANTELGQTVRLELASDAINAYLAVPIPKDFPVGGGKIFRARGRFRLSLGNGGAPVAMLEDVTVFGLSLPKAWLGGLKGENLIGEAVGKRDGSPIIKGIRACGSNRAPSCWKLTTERGTIRPHSLILKPLLINMVREQVRKEQETFTFPRAIRWPIQALGSCFQPCLCSFVAWLFIS